MAISDAATTVLDLVFPPRCPLCGEGISAQSGLCARCWSELVIPGEPSCNLCSRPFAADVQHESTCAPCLARPPRHDGIAAATLYNDASRKLVLSLKHGNRIALAPMMARLMAAKLGFVDEDWVIVPVPLHRWRLWRRGFNQAAALGGELAKQCGPAFLVDGLVRNKATPSLGGLNAKARSRALAGAISVNPKRVDRLRNARIVLVDDVLTSGATSDACVSVLQNAGARNVVVACFARVMDEALDAG